MVTITNPLPTNPALKQHALIARLNALAADALKARDMATYRRATKQALRILGHPAGFVA